MFNCFKALNKKFICSICSACLLCCAIGTSQLKADGEPLLLGENTVSVAEVGKNVFLTDTLKDNLYSSHLLPIFSDMPFLYLDENGNSSLTLSRVSKEGYHQVKYGKDNPSIAVYIAAMPYSEDSSVNEIPFDNLNWYVLDQSSWKNLCVKDPGKYVFFYHVKSTDDGIKGTIDNISLSNIKTANTMVNIVSNNFLLNSEFNEFPEFNSNTNALGFRYSYVDEDESTDKTTTKVIMSNNIYEFLDFFEHLLKGDYTLTGEVHQYNGSNQRLDENLAIKPTPYHFCEMMLNLAQMHQDENMRSAILNVLEVNRISETYPFGKLGMQSDSTKLPNIDINNVSSLTFMSFSGLLKLEFYQVMSGKKLNSEEIEKLVRDNVQKSDLMPRAIVSKDLLDIGSKLRDIVQSNPSSMVNVLAQITALGLPIELKSMKSDVFSVLALVQMVAAEKNDIATMQLISRLMSQYHITQENPNGLKPSSYA